MKKRLIIEIVCAIVIFGIGYLVGDSAAINRINKDMSTKSSEQTAQTSNTSNTSSTSEKDKQKIYKVGEEGASGNWSIKVLDVQEATTIEGGSDNKTTQQKFIVIKLQMTNKGQSAAQYSSSDFLLGDINTKAKYEMNMDAGQTANGKETIYNENGEFFGVYDNANPNMPKQTYIVFEVPKDFNLQNGVLMHGDNGVATGFYLK